ncbi:hypothetical protein E9998_15305 [Glycomyces paridis]|uniref:Uncharacterized protein n=2 Tax=Glycomyces paridis TaxID=2126555 RepID=A0A4S8PFY9_9ACTN|nr:hypothetical protein E9998_15305 [Glycomyces paridis]
MLPVEWGPAAMFALVATPLTIVLRAWIRHRSDMFRERAKTERQRLALRSTVPAERPDILRALRDLDSPPDRGEE